jgi:hypothetical protein
MTTVQQGPSFKRAAFGFFGSTACLCLIMVTLSSL